MKSFEKVFFNRLINSNKFYIKEYYSKILEKNCYVAIKDVEGGLYVVIVSDDKSESVAVSEALEFMKSYKKKFILNAVILTDHDYVYIENDKVRRLVINSENGNIISCDSNCEPLRKILNSIISKKYNKKKNSAFKYNITWTIIIINIMLFLLTVIKSKSILDINASVLLSYGALNRIRVFYYNEYYRLITCAFLHRGLIHITVNMYSLYIIGPQIERLFGKVKYVILYLLTAVSASFLGLILNNNNYQVSIGASGAIFGILGSMLSVVIIERNRVNKAVIMNIIVIIALNLFIGFNASNIDNFAHIGGLIGGVILGFILYKRRKI
ncbi:rhomboid family intramembrane serine protease [Clostridium sp. BJN0001]|uniref:rhomboid family intramembrane serine protease n=1 Tax=Clostridium sp. BJN0001 TaxID=2930219 RepID=UPI001FD18F0E|nr:rhomboid family intramembrane serine protease [Clostridium sp. BJN0001]